MSEESAKLRLPYIAASQAQKHVTHNEALTLLDTLCQASVIDKDLTTPPVSASEGDCYIVAASGTGAWTGWDNRVVRYIDGEWRSYLPGAGSGEGWLVYVQDEDALYVFTGSAWQQLLVAGVWDKGADVASAATVSLGEGGFFHITGTTTITDIDFAAPKDGRWAWVIFDGALTLTHNATTLKLPGGENIVTAAGDRGLFIQDSSDNVYCAVFVPANGNVRLPSGGVVNFAGDVTLTHSADQLAMAGGHLVVQHPDGVAGSSFSSNDSSTGGGAALQSNMMRTTSVGSGGIFTGLQNVVTDNGTTGALSLQSIRNIVNVNGAGNSGVQLYQGRAFYTENNSGSARGLNLNVPSVSGGKTLSSWTAIKLEGSAPAGTITTIKAIEIDAGAGPIQHGSTVVVDANSCLGLRSYTIATLPSAATAARLIYVGDGSGNKRLAVSDGTNWRFPDGAVVS